MASTKARGRATVRYVHKDDKSRTLSNKELKKQPEEIRSDFARTEVERREKATHRLLGKVSWTGTTLFMSDLTKTRTKQLSEEMNVPKELMDKLFLAVGGRGTIGTGGGGSDNELTNWDDTKKLNG